MLSKTRPAKVADLDQLAEAMARLLAAWWRRREGRAQLEPARYPVELGGTRDTAPAERSHGGSTRVHSSTVARP